MLLKLKERYAVSNVVTRVQLFSRINRLRYDGQIMADYVDAFEELYNRLEGMNCTIEENVRVATLLAYCMQAYLHGGAYYINGSWVQNTDRFSGFRQSGGEEGNSPHVANVAMTKNEVLWHNRLGHADVNGIRRLARDDVVIGLELEKGVKTEHVCSDCMKGKMAKLPSRANMYRAKAVGKVINSDICGLMSTVPMGGVVYYVSATDEYSGHATVVPIAKKSEVLDRFKNYLPWFE